MHEPNARIRRLVPQDAPHYRELMLHAYQASPESFTSTRRERELLPLAWWTDRLSDSPTADTLVFGAFDAGTLLGVAGLSRQTGEKTMHKVKILGIFVTEAARGSGLGARLLAAALGHAREMPGTTVAQLTVSRGNEAAIRLYESQGFATFGVEPRAVSLPDSYIEKIHMWREL